jgi:hypothetical protein
MLKILLQPIPLQESLATPQHQAALSRLQRAIR